ncbi:MAG: DUF1592 domain-containing protein [Planctomycetota bacterium]|nr:DUF1592 domain-containing protein [Planctomycetota bacterium]
MSPLLLAPVFFAFGIGSVPPELSERYERRIQPLIERLCVDCHNGSRTDGGVDFERLDTVRQAFTVKRTWRVASRRVAQSEMPPPGAEQPTQSERRELETWMHEAAQYVDPDLPFDPGPALTRRLTREEYTTAVRETTRLGFFNAADFVNFPDNEVASGFDNNAGALSLSATLFEKFLSAADRVTDLWRSGLRATPDPGLNLADWQHRQARDAVEKLISIRPSEGVSPREAATQIVGQFLGKAYRRPPTPAELARLVTLFEGQYAIDQNFDEAVLRACKPALVSPHFVLRIEADPPPAGLTPNAIAGPVSDHALAPRLAFFLWGSPPDDELSALADEGKLQEPTTYRGQVDRLLKHDRGRSLVSRFGAQWLQLSRVDRARPSTEFFPTFNWQLKGSMRQEVERFLDHLRKENAPVPDLLDSRYTFVNSHLARHYNLPAVEGDELVKVDLPGDSPRGGLLGMAAIHAMNAHTHRTSPTLRGKYVLEVLLGAAPPPPPANVSQIQEDDPKKTEAKSFRELLSQHASNKTCAGCHRQIDPLGFALEEFDAIGSFRREGPAGRIDARGTLPNGKSIEGMSALRSAVIARQDEFLRHFAEELLSYALGRPIEDVDEVTIQEILKQSAADRYGFQTFVKAVCESRTFRWRRIGEAGSE